MTTSIANSSCSRKERRTRRRRNERQVEERESHDSIFTVRIMPTKVHVHGLDDAFGTDRVLWHLAGQAGTSI
jgi:hypothetical protein